jgi:Fic/DOC family
MSWLSIADLSPADVDLADPAVPALAGAMHDHVQRLDATDELDAYLERLRRSWAIETGIFERLYEVSDATTATLLEHGLDPAYLASRDTGARDPNEVVAILTDQKATIDGLYAYIAEGGALTKTFLRQLHRQLTAHQLTHEAVERTVCPPDRVEAELDRLIALDRQHAARRLPPVARAAWIHHRFLQIHPFADGNGRIARCLATVVLLRARMMPLVIERASRGSYINALRSADAGDLGPFVKLVEGSQRREIQRAIDVASDGRRDRQTIADRIASLRPRLQRRAAIPRGERQALIATADQAFVVLIGMLDETRTQLDEQLEADSSFQTWTKSASANSDERTFNWFQVTRCAKQLGYFASDRTYQAWAHLGIRVGAHHEILFSLHGMGMGQTEVIACSGMRYERYHRDDGSPAIGDIHPLVEYPCTFTISEHPEGAIGRFRGWVAAAIDAGLEDVGRTL